MALTPRSIVRLPAPAVRGAGTVSVTVVAEWLDPVNFVAATGTLNAVIAGTVYDGVTATAGMHFLYQPLTAGVAQPHVNSGIYTVQSVALPPLRRADADTPAEIKGAAVRVLSGTAWGGTAWINVNTTNPVIGTDSITFRLMDNNVPHAQDILPHAGSINSYVDGSAVIHTAGYAGAFDGGGSDWVRRTAAMPHPEFSFNYFRRVDGGGTTWYEAVTKTVLEGEKLGILGNGVNVTAELNDAIKWMASKGGGRLILPEGIVQCDGHWTIDADSIWIQGSVLGNQSNGKGTLLRMGASSSIFLGGDSAASLNAGTGSKVNQAIKFSDMAIDQLPGNRSYVFNSRDVLRLRFRDIQVRGIYGFHNAGNTNPVTTTQATPNYTRYTFYDSIEGNLTSGSTGGVADSQHFIRMANSTHFWMSNCNIEGSTPIIAASSFVAVPQTAAIKPVNLFISNTSCGNFDRALDIRNGASNIYVNNCLFDRCGTSGVQLTADTTTNFVRFSNTMFKAMQPPTSTQIGANLSESPNPASPGTTFQLQNTSFDNCHFAYFGRSAIRVNQSCFHVSVSNSMFEDNCAGTPTNTEAVIYLAPEVGYAKVVNNQIYKEATGGSFAPIPAYGVRIDSTHSHLQVIGNQISQVGTAGVYNPNRGNVNGRKIHSNTGQFLEGQSHMLVGWVKADVPANQASVFMPLFTAIAGDTLNYLTCIARCKVVGIWIRSQGGSILGGSISVQAYRSGQGLFGPTATLTSGEVEETANDITGAAAYNLGEGITIQYRSSNLNPSAQIDISAGLVVYYD